MLYAYIDFLKRYDVQWYMVGYVKLSNKEIVVSLVRGLVNLLYNRVTAKLDSQFLVDDPAD